MTEEITINAANFVQYPPDITHSDKCARTEEEKQTLLAEAIAYFAEHGGVTDPNSISAWVTGSSLGGIVGYRTITVAAHEAYLARCDKSPKVIAEMICRVVNNKLRSLGIQEEALPGGFEVWIENGVDPTQQLMNCAMWRKTKKEAAA